MSPQAALRHLILLLRLLADRQEEEPDTSPDCGAEISEEDQQLSSQQTEGGELSQCQSQSKVNCKYISHVPSPLSPSLYSIIFHSDGVVVVVGDNRKQSREAAKKRKRGKNLSKPPQEIWEIQQSLKRGEFVEVN